MSDQSEMALLGLNQAELTTLVDSLGEPVYRVRQILDAVYRQRLPSIEQISTLPSALRQNLTERGFSIGAPTIEKRFVSGDGTVRYLIGFADAQTVESVWMPEGDGGEAGDGSDAGDRAHAGRPWDRATICVSSQVGCAVDCQFCLTALLGAKRNLTAGEIVGQVCAVLNDQKVSPPEDRVNLVFMGMGEPFLNFDNFIAAARLLVEEVGIAESRMTVSTAGIVPRIYDFGQEAIRPKLAISLNASSDGARSELMPLNRKWNLAKLMTAAPYPRTNYLRIRAIAGRERLHSKRRRTGRACSWHTLQSEFNCAEPGAWDSLHHSRTGSSSSVSRSSGESRDSGICQASTRAGYLCRLWAAQAYGRDSNRAGIIASIG